MKFTELPAPNDPSAFYVIDVHAFVWKHATGARGNGAETFARWLGGVLRRAEGGRVVAADDAPPGTPTFRHELLQKSEFAGYKADRKKLEGDRLDEYLDVRRAARELLDDLGVPVIVRPTVEADDVIATIATWAAGNRWTACVPPCHGGPVLDLIPRSGFRCGWCPRVVEGEPEPGRAVVIVAADRDLLQLVGEYDSAGRVIMWDGTENYPCKVSGPPECLRGMGVPPERIPDFFALTGGKNNIPGVTGIGPKAAVEILARRSLLDTLRLLDACEGKAEMGGEHAMLGMQVPTIARSLAKLKAGADAARLSLTLATLRRDLPLDFPDILRRSPYPPA